MPAERRNSSSPTKFEAASFNQDVYALVRRVPEGKVASYGQIAKLLGFPKHARAVGAALKLLPPEFSSPTLPQAEQEDGAIAPAPEINLLFCPWHRIVSGAGVISPRGSTAAVNIQATWLRNEGVEVNQTIQDGGDGVGTNAFGLGGGGVDGGRVSMRIYCWERDEA